MRENRYLKEKYNRMRTWSRIRLGVQQLIQRPYWNLLIFLALGSFPVLKRIANQMLLHMPVSEKLLPVFEIAMRMINVIVPILLVFYIIQTIGEKTAEKEEANIISAFIHVKVMNQPPILWSKKTDRRTGVTVREFYTNQPMYIWKEKMEDIEDAFSGRLVGKKLEYGGKNHEDGKKIIMHMAKGRQGKDRGIMYE